MVSVAQAAAAMGRSSRTIRRWVGAGLLPAYRVQGRLLLSLREIEAFLDRHRAASDVEPDDGPG
jgi:excisionase family DNA binding protein